MVTRSAYSPELASFKSICCKLSDAVATNNKKSGHLAESTAGFAEQKTLAVVQHESLLMFRDRPFEVPYGCTTMEAKRQAKEEQNEAVLEMLVKVKHQRYVQQARIRRSVCKDIGIPDASHSNAQLKEAVRTWRKATRHRLNIAKEEAPNAKKHQELKGEGNVPRVQEAPPRTTITEAALQAQIEGGIDTVRNARDSLEKEHTRATRPQLLVLPAARRQAQTGDCR